MVEKKKPISRFKIESYSLTHYWINGTYMPETIDPIEIAK